MSAGALHGIAKCKCCAPPGQCDTTHVGCSGTTRHVPYSVQFTVLNGQSGQTINCTHSCNMPLAIITNGGGVPGLDGGFAIAENTNCSGICTLGCNPQPLGMTCSIHDASILCQLGPQNQEQWIMQIDVGISSLPFGTTYGLTYYRNKLPGELCAPAGVYLFAGSTSDAVSFTAPATITVTNP